MCVCFNATSYIDSYVLPSCRMRNRARINQILTGDKNEVVKAKNENEDDHFYVFLISERLETKKKPYDEVKD